MRPLGRRFRDCWSRSDRRAEVDARAPSGSLGFRRFVRGFRLGRLRPGHSLAKSSPVDLEIGFDLGQQCIRGEDLVDGGDQGDQPVE